MEPIKGKEFTISAKEAWDQNVSSVAGFISMVAYLEHRSKEDVLNEFVEELKKEL